MTGARDILYVDDDEGLGRLVARALKPHDLVVHHVRTGREGVELLKARTFDVVALDHDLGADVDVTE